MIAYFERLKTYFLWLSGTIIDIFKKKENFTEFQNKYDEYLYMFGN